MILNSQSGYIKIDAFLLILCHVISDVKLSHCSLLSKVKNVFQTIKSFRIQYLNIKKQPLLERRKTSAVHPLSANFTKWPNTPKHFVGNLPTNCLSVFGHFVGLALKRLNTNHFKTSLFLVFICVFWSLNCNKNGLRHKCFSEEVMFYNSSATKCRLPMLS